MTLEETLSQVFAAEGITPEHQKEILAYLTVLKQRDEKTYEHSIRVALKTVEIVKQAHMPGITPRMMLWAGLLHDIGKTLIPPELLKKTGGFTEADYQGMEPHVEYGWKMLQACHDYTAHIIVRHHQFGPKPYPSVLPDLPGYLKDKRGMIDTAARLLSLADYYDAIATRQNNKFGKPLTPEEKKAQYEKDNADRAELVLQLEIAGILRF
jgi:putative nucleotidyltransferase with HDIG domain